uniref:SH3 domain-containing protein n=1 Tax=Gasterosteus aculeatus aculeatus TaxID=481459 RepID=G3NRP2_GASAC
MEEVLFSLKAFMLSRGFRSLSPQLQRLKRSLSFKSVMRSKSVDNFFQRANGESRPPPALIASPPRPQSPPRSPSPPGLGAPPSHPLVAQPRPLVHLPARTHCFQEHHVFGVNCPVSPGNSKQGLRCKACKLPAHLWCSSELSQQPCNGKVSRPPTDFSSSVTTAVCSVFPPDAAEADNGTVDPVYEALRYGTSLAHMSRSSFSSISESPPCVSLPSFPLRLLHSFPFPLLLRSFFLSRVLSLRPPFPFPSLPSPVLTPPESEKADSEDRVSLKVCGRLEVHSIHTYVALYKFLPQEKNDLELQISIYNRVCVCTSGCVYQGKSRDRAGLFPANFVQRVRPGERVWKVSDGFHGNRDKGQMTVKEAQICVGKNEEIDGFLRLSSGKKRGLVPVKNLLEI